MTELFRYFQKFMPLNPESLAALEKICSVVHLKKGDNLQYFGQTCRTIYFINSGVARIYYYKDGVDITESFSFEGDIIARVESLFTGNPSQKAIQVLEDTCFVAINAVQLFALYDSHPQIERLFRLIFEAGYVETVKRIESIQFHTAEDRYEALLLKPNLLQRIPLKHIASYLGITQVSLSRIRAIQR
ncbi:Crp/Fnr family transcriptional regulator [Lacihabitans soyangensis]|uniref:Crp/Fnr family transcriptional regulator n=1 Tax=Lacihabitans soyangensis TaxID=869394 RepID=A0AAE3KRN5_9BACT|nr:Crp/Fnr family transcriptional regulator [Lacihabitans soyangensis]MCP9762397.1 Crp/Fnr family transcriptional regulator [Lacihabitans soyangensis]